MSKNTKRNRKRDQRWDAAPMLPPARIFAPVAVPSGPAGQARGQGHTMVLSSGATSELGTSKTVLMRSHTAVVGPTAQGATAGYDAFCLTDAECAAILRNATFRFALKNRKP